LHGTLAAKPPIIRGGQVTTACGGSVAAALRLHDELRTAGYAAEILPTMDGDFRLKQLFDR
jgi:hypothetical protein